MTKLIVVLGFVLINSASYLIGNARRIDTQRKYDLATERLSQETQNLHRLAMDADFPSEYLLGIRDAEDIAFRGKKADVLFQRAKEAYEKILATGWRLDWRHDTEEIRRVSLLPHRLLPCAEHTAR